MQTEMPPAPQAMLPVTESRLHKEPTAGHNGAAPNPPVPAKSPAISPGVPLRPGNALNHGAVPFFPCLRLCPEETPPVPVSLHRPSLKGEWRYNRFLGKAPTAYPECAPSSSSPDLSFPQACGTTHRLPGQTTLLPTVYPKTVHITQGLHGKPAGAGCPHFPLRSNHPKSRV